MFLALEGAETTLCACGEDGLQAAKPAQTATSANPPTNTSDPKPAQTATSANPPTNTSMLAEMVDSEIGRDSMKYIADYWTCKTAVKESVLEFLPDIAEAMSDIFLREFLKAEQRVIEKESR